MKHALKNNIAAMEPKLAAQNAYTANLKRKFNGTVWKSGCSSWYLNKDGDVSKKRAMHISSFINFGYIGLWSMAQHSNHVLVENLESWIQEFH